jgi:cytochrome c oxidase accessory protein FixG
MFGFAGTRRWVYVQHITGKFQSLRRRTFLLLHVILFGLPWLTVAGNPALLFDLPGRRLYAFGATFTANDTILLLLLLLFLAFSLFFFTALFGRLWCGYACPQTVFLDAWVHPIERWIEGERTTRMRRDMGPWTFDRAWRKATKWSLFALAAFIVSMSFMGFFVPVRELWSGVASGSAYALVAIFTGVWFLDFTWFREQFCNFLCPYARFQSVMVDDQTLLVGYDELRGEPRGKAARAEGRCIDCNKCVIVCPTGIDIRRGFQLECIGCARCVDACTDVMGRFGHESLIGYGSLATLARRRARFWRPRTVGYAALLAGLIGVTTALLAVRVPFDVSVARAPGTLYTVDDDGFVRNTYLLRVSNNLPGEPVSFSVAVDGIDGAVVATPDFELGATEGRIVALVVRVPQQSATAARTLPLQVRISSSRAGARVLNTTFKTAGADGEGIGP